MKRTLMICALVALSNCSREEIEASLQALRSCEELEQQVRTDALAEMNRELDSNLEAELEWRWRQIVRCLERRTGDPSAPSDGDLPLGGGMWTCDAQQSKCAQENTSASGAAEVSDTNVQVEGVDEADFVKNDNKHIYIVADDSFRIVEAWPARTTREIARVSIEGLPLRLFVKDDRALIYSSTGVRSNRSCTYGYACDFVGDGSSTKITVFDISDRSAPRLVRELKLSGSLVNARRVGSAVYTVVSSPSPRFPGLRYAPQQLPYAYSCDEFLGISLLQVQEAFEQLRRQNEKVIRETLLTDLLPSIVDTIHAGASKIQSENILGQCEEFYRSSIADGDQLTTLLGLDMTVERPPRSTTIISRPGAVYASPGALYIAVPHERQSDWRQGWYRTMDENQVTTVHKFQINAATATSRYVASGLIEGRVLNQFSMDEREGYLRIATTSGHLPSPDVHSTVTILEQSAAQLQQTGVLDNLAPGEDIRAVRFDGARGYVVTFKKTDPLFVFDLEQPSDPRVLGELKIPGFSTYMQMIDDQHLLSVGYDADDQGDFAWFQGVILQIFDSTDPTQPKLLHKEVIGTRGSSSEALTDHLAFTYFAPKRLLALPMTICEGGDGGSYGTDMTFSGLMVYDVSVDSGFALRGKVSHADGAGATCSNWWTNASSAVKRSIVMDDYVFSISSSVIKVNHLDQLAVDVASVSLVGGEAP